MRYNGFIKPGCPGSKSWLILIICLLTNFQIIYAQSGGWDATSTNGAAGLTDHGNGVIQMIDVTPSGCAAGAVHETTDLYDPTIDGVFSKCYQVYFGCPGDDQIGSDTKGDGLAFSFSKCAFNINNGLACGGGLGYMGACPQMITIEFDTWSSQGTNNFDNAYEGTGNEDQVAIHVNGDASFTGKLVGVNAGNLEDGLEHEVCITYNPASDQMIVELDGNVILSQILTGTGYELENYFGAGGLQQTWSSGKAGATNPATVSDGADITDNVGGPLCPANVFITSPTDGDIFGACGDDITIEASVTAPSGNTVDYVEFFVDGISIGTDNTFPYSIDWTSPDNGNHTLTATGYYIPSGTNSTSTAVTVSVGAEVMQTTTAPTIDGIQDALWNNYVAIPLNQGAIAAPDLDGTYRIAYDANNLYFLFDVTDDVLVQDGGNPWDNDGVEVFIDIGNDKAGTYGADDFQYIFQYNNEPNFDELQHSPASLTGVTFGTNATAGGYIIEASIPWTTMATGTPTPGSFLGLEVKLNDDDDGGAREDELAWADGTFSAWNNTALFGTQVISACDPITAEVTMTSGEFCTGDSVKLSASPRDDSYLYQWFFNGTSIGSPQAGDSVLWVTAGGNYSVEVDNGILQDTSDEVTVIENVNPTASAGSDQSFCSGTGGVTLSGSGGGNYSWSPGTGLSATNVASPSANPSTTTIYTLTVTDPTTGCSASDEVTVTVNETPDQPSISLSNTTPCIGTIDNFQVTGSGADYFVWTLPGGANITSADSDSSDITIDWGAATSGSVSVVAVSNSCVSTSTTQSLTFSDIPSSPSISGEQNLCDGADDEIYFVGVQSGASYSWTTSFTPSSGSSNSITITDFGSATSGTIEVEVSNSCGSVNDMITVNITRFGTLDITGPTDVVCNSSGNSYSVSGGQPGSTFFWTIPSGADFTASDADSTEISVDFGTNGGQVQVVENNSGCTSGSESVNVAVSGCDLMANFSASGYSICIGEEVTFTDASSSVSGVETWSWDFGDDASPASANDQGPHVVSYSSPGVKDVVLTVTEGVAVHDTTIQVTVEATPDAPILSGPTGTVCENDDIDVLVDNSVSGAYYNWDISGIPGAAYNDVSQQTGPDNDSININIGTSGGEITVIQTINGCPGPEGSITIDVIGVPDAPIIDGPSVNLCGGSLGSDVDTFSIDPVSLANNYIWNFPGSAVVSYNTDKTEAYVNFPTIGSYQVSVFALGACGAGPSSSGFPVTVTETVTPSVSFSASKDTVCANDPVIFTATVMNEGTSPEYYWFMNGEAIGDSTSGELTLNSFTDGDSIWVVMNSSEACVDTNPVVSADTVLMTVLTTPVAEAGENMLLDDFQEINLASSEYSFYTTTEEPISYLWWSSDSSLVISNITPATVLDDVLVTPDEDSTWFYLLVDNGVCSAMDSMYVLVDFDIWIPTGFSPNNDGNNDGFQIHNIDQFPGNRVEIYNRWGSLVWSQDNYTNENQWTGQVDGKDLPMATYYYIINLNDASGRSFAGPVTLVK